MGDGMTKKIDVYLVSSTLHFFWALLFAYTHKERESQLIFIDQETDNPLSFYAMICDVSTPFTKVSILLAES